MQRLFCNFKTYFCFVLMFIFVHQTQVYAQKQNLQVSKKEIIREIDELNTKLKYLAKNKVNTEKRIQLITKKISSRESLLRVYKKEIKQISYRISNMSDSIDVINNRVVEIKANYAELLRSFQIQQSNSNNWLFILDAKNLQQAYKRYNYLKQYSDYRKSQVKTLLTHSELLKEKKDKLDKKRQSKRQIEKEQLLESNNLIADKVELKSFAVKLGSEEQDVLKKIKEKKKIAAEIDRKIREIIRKERELAKKRAEALANKNKGKTSGKTTSKPVLTFAETPQGKLVSKKFSGNKGKLPWPTKHGEIKHKFGPYHPKGLPNITFHVKGLEIKTPLNENVYSVFGGKVSAVFLIPNGTKGIVVRHGSYVTIYANLKDVKVKEGDLVKVNTNLGKVGSEDGNFGSLDFQIWIEYKASEQNLNPELWLQKR